MTVTVNDVTLTVASGQSFTISEIASSSTSVGTVALSADTAVAWSLLSNGAMLTEMVHPHFLYPLPE